MNPSISVIIPNYNGKNLLSKAIPSVSAALKESASGYEIIVSDDGSEDGSVDWLKAEFRDVKIVASNINTGFSGAVNRGAGHASMDLIFILNSDIALEKNYFNEQFKYFLLPDTFGTMGKICDPVSGRVMDSAKYPEWKFTSLSTTRNLRVGSPAPKSPKGDLSAHSPPFGSRGAKNIPTLFLSGANALMDRKKFMTLGGFDELFNPFYMEDADLGVRAWRMGWKCYFEPGSACYHSISSTIARYYSKKKIKQISRRNKFYFCTKHLAGWRRFAWGMEIFSNLISRWLILDISYYNSFFQFLIAYLVLKKNKTEFSRILKTIPTAKNLNEAVDFIKTEMGFISKRYF